MKRRKRLLSGLICGVLMAAMIVPAMASGNTEAREMLSDAGEEITAEESGYDNSAGDETNLEENNGSEDSNQNADELVTEGTVSQNLEDNSGNEDLNLENPDDDGNTDIAVTGVSLSSSKMTLNVIDQTKQLTATVKPDDATDQSVTWSSDKTSVAKVDKNGKITAVGDGTATITVKTTDGGYTAECIVTVSLYNGFHKDPDGSDWYYYKNGKVSTGTTDVMKGTVDGTSGWWRVVKGKVTPGETVAQNSNGWWYINEKGRVDFNYTGYAKNYNGWWYIENGKVTFKKNGVIKDTKKKVNGTSSWYYVVGSKVQSSYTGVANYRNANGWWYIKNGAVDFTANTVAKNNNGWWYIENGKVNFSYNGFAKNYNGWWYVENGKVTFNKSSVIKDKQKKIDGTSSWWYVSNSQVITSFNGIASNSNGTWLIQNGKVNFDFNGKYSYNGVTYNVVNGKASALIKTDSRMSSKAKTISSSTKWLIMVDRTNCKVGIFNGSKGNWSAEKYWTCSLGKPSRPTPRGMGSIWSKGKAMYRSTYTCWYWSDFNNGNRFHSVLYNPGSMTSIKNGTLGQHISNGCIRLEINNAKWIYDNIPMGTAVYVYD